MLLYGSDSDIEIDEDVSISNVINKDIDKPIIRIDESTVSITNISFKDTYCT